MRFDEPLTDILLLAYLSLDSTYTHMRVYIDGVKVNRVIVSRGLFCPIFSIRTESR